ncbi:MAG: DUF1553 domain-containing protein [Planctomycetaceae bacterium]
MADEPPPTFGRRGSGQHSCRQWSPESGDGRPRLLSVRILEKTDHSPHYEYHKFDPADPASHRRSIYRFIVRSQPDPLMTTLDCADSSQSTPKRTETLTSLQALSLLNNRFVLTMSEAFAERLQQRSGTTAEKVAFAFEHATGRQPTADEAETLSRYVDEHGFANLCRVLFNLSEFVFVD